MPTHHGTRTKVSLLVADLDSTTTKEPETVRGHSESARKALERCENDLRNSRELKESFIPLGSDDLNTLHFLGQDGAYMPFMMVRAGKELRQNPTLHRDYHPNPVRDAIYTRVLGHSPAEAISTPHALAIRLDISEQTFLKTNLPANDMKIDILFNGKFTNATTVPSRTIKDKRSTFVFGGLRTHYMLERPWVVLPRDKNADGSQRHATPRKETPQDRWNELAQVVSEEVSLRTTHVGGHTPVVEYFDALAKLPMPPEMEQWDERDTHRYSVIDVVLSYGYGGKDAANSAYLVKPTRLRPRPKPSQGLPPVPVRRSEDIAEVHKSISDIEIRKEKNIVTSSEQLPKYLTGAMEKAGLGVQTSAEQASRWSTASAMLKDVLDRGPKETLKPEPTTPLQGLPPPMSPPRSSLFTRSRLKEVTVPSDLEVPYLKLPPATPWSLIRDTSKMSLDSPSPVTPPPRVTRSGNRYTTINSGSPRKRRRRSSTESTGIGISSRGIFTTAGSHTDLSALEAPNKRFVHPDALMPPPLSPLKYFGDMSLETPKEKKASTRVIFKLGGMHVRTADVPTRLLTSMPPPLTTPSRTTRNSTPRRIARPRGVSRRITTGPASSTPYTLFPNTYTTPALASPFATAPTTPASTVATPPHTSSRSRNRGRARGDSTLKLSAERQADHEASFRAFAAPPASRDAAVSYSAVRPAWQGTQWTRGMERGAGGGVVRQIRTERGGEFREEGIVLGVRFVVF